MPVCQLYCKEQRTPQFPGLGEETNCVSSDGMSLTALTMVLVSIAAFGVVHEADEGAIAHVWQLLMAGQMPILLFFALKWLPRAPKQALFVLALQTGAALAAMAPVYYLKL
jgi:hypothetical protein